MAGDAAIEIAMLDVAADFLRADEPYLQFIVIHVGSVGAAAHLDIESGLGHLFDCGVLQAAFGQAKLELPVVHLSLLGNSALGICARLSLGGVAQVICQTSRLGPRRFLSIFFEWTCRACERRLDHGKPFSLIRLV